MSALCLNAICATLAFAVAPAASIQQELIPEGKGKIHVDVGSDSPITVWTYRPTSLTSDAQVVFVMHGARRQPDKYREPWIEYADRHGWLLLLPEFSKARFPGSRNYNLLGIMDADGKLQANSSWLPAIFESIFQAVKTGEQLNSDGFYLYGHSAGGQVVHRTMLFAQETNVYLAIAANSGWYTLPELDRDFPGGLKNTGVGPKQLAKSLERNVVVLLGEEDNDPEHPQLSQRSEAVIQGPHRLARGKYFYGRIQEAATTLQTPVNWKLKSVPGVAHSNGGMAGIAAQLIAKHRPHDSSATLDPVQGEPK